jgi:hypothetical protein
MSQGALILALLALLALSVGAIALLAFLSARGQDIEEAQTERRNQVGIDEALELHRQRMFLRRHPEWEGRDFRADRSSPWYTDEEFAGGRRAR